MSENRKRKTSLTLRLTAEEKALLISAKEKANYSSLREYISDLSKNANCVVISEVQDYDALYTKIGNLSNQIAKALNTIVKEPQKHKSLLNYLEKNDNQVLKALLNYSENLEKIIESHLEIENVIEIKKASLIREYKKAKV